MHHCKVCGNPVSKDETECRMCGSKLNASTRKGSQRVFATIRPSLGSDYGPQDKNEQTTAFSPSVYTQEANKMGVSKKLLASILVLVIVVVAVGFGIYALLDLSPSGLGPFNPQGESLAVRNYDNHTIEVDFRNFDSSTQFSDCTFRISIGAWTSSVYGIQTWQSFIITSDYNYYSIDAYFVDMDDNGMVDNSDYCILYTETVPEGLQCSMEILNAHTGLSICSADFAF
jgi:hypothetical protein